MNALRRALITTHRWLGIAGGLLFVLWFVSGIVMMYARMPRLSPEERLWRIAPLDLATARVTPLEAARRTRGAVQRVRVGMIGTRPVYRFQSDGKWTTVFADSGAPLTTLSTADALRIAADFTRRPEASLQHRARLDQPDQWTLQLRGLLPMHLIRVLDDDGTAIYVSEPLGDVVMQTSRRSRVLGYAGAVPHWLYVTPLRRNGPVWTRVVIWTSAAGCLLCVTGLAWGLWQLLRAGRSPYAGLMRWHHYAGLCFGLGTFTFVFSGLLSMNPNDWSPGTAPTAAQREAVAGGTLSLESATLERLESALEALRAEMPVKEIVLTRFQGRLYAQGYRPPESLQAVRDTIGDPGDVVGTRVALEHRLASVDRPSRSLSRFRDEEIARAARLAMPGVPIREESWLTNYDAYYYDRDARLPLPVLRVRFADAAETWLYLDPFRGVIARREERRSRVNRWLYHGFHSIDFPWLYRQRPLWDVLVVLLSAGGLFVTLSSMPAGWRRLMRQG